MEYQALWHVSDPVLTRRMACGVKTGSMQDEIWKPVWIVPLSWELYVAEPLVSFEGGGLGQLCVLLIVYESKEMADIVPHLNARISSCTPVAVTLGLTFYLLFLQTHRYL